MHLHVQSIIGLFRLEYRLKVQYILFCSNYRDRDDVMKHCLRDEVNLSDWIGGTWKIQPELYARHMCRVIMTSCDVNTIVEIRTQK